MVNDAEAVGRDSTNGGRETSLNADLAAGGANWDGMIGDVEDEVVAADPAALDGDDAAIARGLMSATGLLP